MTRSELREIVGARVRENEEFRGKSGRRYRVPAILLDPKESHPEHFVAMLAHRQVVPQHFAMFYDLHGAFPAVVNDSVYDESSDFRDEDRAFLQSVSNVMSFMEAPIRFRRLTGNA